MTFLLDRGLVLVTRNAKDFGRFDVKLLNPWRNNESG